MTMHQDDAPKVGDKRVEENDGKEVDIEKGKSIENSNAKPPVGEFQPHNPYPTRMKKTKHMSNTKGSMIYLSDCMLTYHLLMLCHKCQKYAKFF